MLIKLKFRFPEIVFGLLLAVAVFAMGMLFSSRQPIQNQGHHETTNAAEHKSTKVSSEERLADYTYWLMILTGILAGSTICLWIVTWRIGRRQVRDTEVLQRAYINAVALGVTSRTDGLIVGQIVFRNVGHLPATNFRWVIKPMEVQGEKWVPPEISDSELLEFSSIVPIAGEFRRGTEAMSPTVPQSGEYLFVWGRVKYLDGFDCERGVTFCHSYPTSRRETPPGGGYKISIEYARYHDFGNSAD